MSRDLPHSGKETVNTPMPCSVNTSHQLPGLMSPIVYPIFYVKVILKLCCCWESSQFICILIGYWAEFICPLNRVLGCCGIVSSISSEFSLQVFNYFSASRLNLLQTACVIHTGPERGCQGVCYPGARFCGRGPGRLWKLFKC